jgi:hypothetical protein
MTQKNDEEIGIRSPTLTGQQIVTKSILKTAQSYIKDAKPKARDLKDGNSKDESIKWGQASIQESPLLPVQRRPQPKKNSFDLKPPVDQNQTLNSPPRNRQQSLDPNPRLNKTLGAKVPRAERRSRDPKAGRGDQLQNPQKPITTFQMGRKTRDTKRRNRNAVIAEDDKESSGNLLIDTEFDKDVMSPKKKEP